jgi:hypothetical protein
LAAVGVVGVPTSVGWMIGTELVGSIDEGRGTGIAAGAEMFIGFAVPGAPLAPGGMPGMPALDRPGGGSVMPGTSEGAPGVVDGVAAGRVDGMAAG